MQCNVKYDYYIYKTAFTKTNSEIKLWQYINYKILIINVFLSLLLPIMTTPNKIIIDVAALTIAANSDRVSPAFHFLKLPVTLAPSRIFLQSGGGLVTASTAADETPDQIVAYEEERNAS
jgi:hypothetical protein